MISPRMVKVISCLPKGLLSFISKKLLKSYIKKYANLEIKGLENLKDVKEPILFVCNHLSNSDALILDKVLKKYNITFVAGIKLASNPLTNLGMNITKTIAIKPNTADREAISSIINTLKGGENVLIFPEGTRSRTGSLIEGKKGVVLIQKLSKATVVPIGMTGSEKLLPINEKNMGLEKFQYSDLTINIGKPIPIDKRQKGEGKHDYEERILNSMMINIAKLLPEGYRGFYKGKII